jgi:hypothetical protein
MSTKLTLEAANDLFKKIGVEVAVVAEAEQADANPDLENIAKGVFSEMETKIRHDVEFEIKDEARKEEAGKQLGSLRTIIKRQFGLDEKEIKELSMQDMIKLAHGKFSANKSDADNDLAKRLEEAQRERAELEETYEAKLNAKDEEWKEKFQDKDIEERLFSLVNGAARSGGDAVAQKNAIKNALKSNYHLRLNEATKEIEIFDKQNPERKAFDNKNVITDKYFVEKQLRDLGVLATDTRHIIPKDVIEGKPTAVKSGVAQLAPTDAMEFIKESMQQA